MEATYKYSINNSGRWKSLVLASILTALIGVVGMQQFESFDYEAYIFGASFLGLSLSFLILASYDLLDVSLIFVIYFALHYLVMLPLYGAQIAWNQFAAYLEGNWSLIAEGTLAALLAILGYSLGLLLGNRTHVRMNQLRFEYLTHEKARSLIWLYALLGLLGWILIVITNDGDDFWLLYNKENIKGDLFRICFS